VCRSSRITRIHDLWNSLLCFLRRCAKLCTGTGLCQEPVECILHAIITNLARRQECFEFKQRMINFAFLKQSSRSFKHLYICICHASRHFYEQFLRDSPQIFCFGTVPLIALCLDTAFEKKKQTRCMEKDPSTERDNVTICFCNMLQ